MLHATNALMLSAGIARLRQSKAVIAALAILILGAILLAWWKFSRASEPPILTVTQALLLGCTDYDPRDYCTPYRVAGAVVAGPVRGNLYPDDLEFTLTDGCFDWPVHFHGGGANVAHLQARDFVVLEGSTFMDGEFHSDRIFAGPEAARLGRGLRQVDYHIPRQACLHREAAETRVNAPAPP